MSSSSISNRSSAVIDAAALRDFLRSYQVGSFAGQRLGQACFNHFHLDQRNDLGFSRQSLDRLYAMDGDDAMGFIHHLFAMRRI